MTKKPSTSFEPLPRITFSGPRPSLAATALHSKIRRRPDKGGLFPMPHASPPSPWETDPAVFSFEASLMIAPGSEAKFASRLLDRLSGLIDRDLRQLGLSPIEIMSNGVVE